MRAGAAASLSGGGSLKRPRAARAPQPRMTDADQMAKLLAFVEACGGHAGMLNGWKAHTDTRREGRSAGAGAEDRTPSSPSLPAAPARC